jgi:hypothetical protein
VNKSGHAKTPVIINPGSINIVVGVLTLMLAVVSAARLNYNATMRVNQQLLEGIKLGNQQLLEGLKPALSQMEKRFDERFARVEDRVSQLERYFDARFEALAADAARRGQTPRPAVC